MKLRCSVLLHGAAAILAAVLGVTACGTDAGPTGHGGGGNGGNGGSGGNGHGGQGGAPMKMCPASPPNNMDDCAGFAIGAQCNYGSSSTGVLSSTECQCAGLAGGGQAWSCGTEAVGAGPGSGSSSSGG
jgi:hypothetical protein